MVSIFILGIVFILIAIRRVGKIRLQIWQIMASGAIAVLLTGQISPGKAAQAINIDVMLFLFGMFVVGQALERSGYLSHLSSRVLRSAKTANSLILYILFGIGVLSAFLMNDTLAIIGTPVMLQISRKTNLSAKVLLLTLAFSVTIGSVMSPIGNPQNLLVALNGKVNNPFATFLKYLALPTFINLLIAYLLLKLFYHRQFQNGSLNSLPGAVTDRGLARLCQLSLILLVMLVLAKIITVFTGFSSNFKLTYIALLSAAPIILFSPKRFPVLKNIDWSTLIFFAAMFILMASVWETGIFQTAITDTHLNLISVSVILAVSIILSQFISNVPLVALYLPMLTELGASTKQLMSLAAGSTIAGNLSILGAASNVIIIQNAEKRSGDTITFFEFIKIGVPLTAANALVYWALLSFW